MLTVYCPLCHGMPAEPTLEEYTVTVKSPHENSLGGLCVHQCALGHIFFLREADVGIAIADATAA